MRQGQLFAERYVILDRLGEGGMGVVYRARDERLPRLVALKLMKPQFSHDPTFQARFEREAAAAVGFEHPNVVPVYDYAQDEGTLYLVMRYVEGPDLHSEIRSLGRLDLRRTVDLVAQVAAGLSAGHRRGHVHRDVKPANILLGRGADGSEQALLTDFGLAQPQAGGQGLTATGMLVGTPAYMAPEQLTGDRASVRSDVYALACVAFECLTGRPPFEGSTDAQVMHGHLSLPVPDLRSLAPDVPAEVAAVVENGLAKPPADRPASADELAAGLRAAAARHVEDEHRAGAYGRTRVLPVPPRSPRQDVGSARTPSRTRRLLPVAVGVVVLAFAGSAAAGYLTDPSRTSPAPPGDAASSAPTSPPQDPHDTLAARLPTDVYSECRPDPEREGEGRTTSLKCKTPLAGADELLVSQWSDAATMAADFARVHGGKPDGKCGKYAADPASGLRTTWRGDAPMACFINSEPAAILLWEYPDRALQVVAVRRDEKPSDQASPADLADDSRALFEWWRTAVRSDPT